MSRIVLSMTIFLLAASFSSAQALSGAEQSQAEQALGHLLIGKVFVAKATFPAWKNGIDLNTDGTWDAKWATRAIKDHGVGIATGDRTSVTAVKVRDKHIEVHLDGGGLGTLMDSLMTSDAKKGLRESSGGKLPGGSRINLRFGRPLTGEDVTDLGQLARLLEPLVDASALLQEASRQQIPDEYKTAAARGDVVVGMEKTVVFAIMGEPKRRDIDTSGETPTEKWVFELKNLKTRVVTFKEGKVTKVDEF